MKIKPRCPGSRRHNATEQVPIRIVATTSGIVDKSRKQMQMKGGGTHGTECILYRRGGGGGGGGGGLRPEGWGLMPAE